MSGVKHTPGPWEAREVRTQVGRAFRIGAGEMLEAGKGCCIIYDDYCGNPENERKANARLIASAPDLLEALIHARSVLQMMTDPEAIQSSTVINVYAQAIEAERKAGKTIARARGEQSLNRSDQKEVCNG